MNQFKKVRLIFNPKSGAFRDTFLQVLVKRIFGVRDRSDTLQNKSPEEILNRIVDCLTRFGISVDKVMTQRSGEASAIAQRSAEENYDLVIVAGGDGTIHEVINGLVGSRTILGVIPFGTANIYALETGVPLEIEKACELIVQGEINEIDLGKVSTRKEQRYFLCMVGIGFDADIVKHVQSRFKKIMGVLAFPVVGFKRVFSYPFRVIKVFVDGKTTLQKGYILIVGNTKYYGGGMMLSNIAQITDGLLDACLFKQRGFFNVLGYVQGLRTGTIQKFPDVHCFQCQKIQIVGRWPHDIQLDGEYFGHTPATIEIVPHALRAIMPRKLAGNMVTNRANNSL